jgi:hypothetical protein
MQSASGILAPRADANNPYLLRFLFAVFLACVLARLFVTANILDLFLNYTASQGAFIEKIHPANYSLAAVAVVAMLAIRIELTAWELRVVRAFIAFVGFIVMVFAIVWPVASAGYLLDAYVFACIAATLMFVFPRAWRESVGNAILVFLIVSAAIAIGEFVTKHRLLPYPNVELGFRPTGLLGHPLNIGTCTGMAIAFVAATRWSAMSKFLGIVILLMGAFAANARLGTIVATGVTLLVVLWSQFPSVVRERRTQIKILIVIAAVLALPVMIAGLLALGFADRLQSALFDESAMARVSIYRVFELVTWQEILLGSDIEAVRKLAADRFELEFIESPFIIFVFQLGLIGAVAFILVLTRTFWVVVSGARRNVVLATVAYFVVALGNNTLATKTPTIAMLFLLIIAFHPPAGSHGSARNWR